MLLFGRRTRQVSVEYQERFQTSKLIIRFAQAGESVSSSAKFFLCDAVHFEDDARRERHKLPV